MLIDTKLHSRNQNTIILYDYYCCHTCISDNCILTGCLYDYILVNLFTRQTQILTIINAAIVK